MQHEGCGEQHANILGLWRAPRKVAQAAGLVCRAGVSAEEQGTEEGEEGGEPTAATTFRYGNLLVWISATRRKRIILMNAQ